MKNLILISLILLSCNKFKINKHYSFHVPQTTWKTTIHGEAYFDATCIYELETNYDQINKLVGLSNGTNHHENSIRIGWIWNTETLKFDLYAYYYVDGVRGEKEGNLICSVAPNKKFDWSIKLISSQYRIDINGNTWVLSVDMEMKQRYILFPYFGGSEEFPNDKNCLIWLNIK